MLFARCFTFQPQRCALMSWESGEWGWNLFRRIHRANKDNDSSQTWLAAPNRAALAESIGFGSRSQHPAKLRILSTVWFIFVLTLLWNLMKLAVTGQNQGYQKRGIWNGERKADHHFPHVWCWNPRTDASVILDASGVWPMPGVSHGWRYKLPQKWHVACYQMLHGTPLHLWLTPFINYTAIPGASHGNPI